MNNRRVGLSKRNKPRSSLLSIIGGKSTADFSARKAAQAQRQTIMDDLDSPVSDYRAPPRDSDDDSSPRPSKNIINTLERKSQPAQKKAEEKIGLQRRSSTSTRGKQSSSVSSSQSGGSSGSKKRYFKDDGEEEGDTMPLSLSSQISTIGRHHDPFSSSQQSKKRPKMKTFGKKGKMNGSSQDGPRGSPEKKGSNKILVCSDIDTTPESTPKKSKFKIPPSFDSPDERKFKKVAALSPSPAKNLSPLKHVLLSRHCSDSDDDDIELPATIMTTDEKKIKKIVAEKQKKEAKSPVAKFKAYELPDYANGTVFENMGFTQMDREIMDHDTATKLPDHLVECPMCSEPVEKDYLEEFSKGERMTVTSQTKFCQSHKTRSARMDWKSRGYPDIDWDALDSRIKKHHKYLATLLIPDPPSYYHNKVSQDLKASTKTKLTAKSIIHSGGTLTPGYYGTRGYRTMSENIMDKFSSQLKVLAPQDKVIFALGIPQYVGMVLVPELAVRLIQADMNVSLAEAREIFKDSAAVGDLLQEELDEVVVREDDEADDSVIIVD